MADLDELLRQRAASDPRLRAILKQIGKGNADFYDTAVYSKLYSKILGKTLSQHVIELSPDEREELCESLLRGSYEEINDVLAQVQTSLDEKTGVHIRPQRAAFPTERVTQLAHSLSDPTVDDKVIKRRANTGVASVSMSFHDDYIKANAAFRNDAGMRCHIVREGANCCAWCSSLVGRYEYPDSIPDDVFRRHDNCTCTVTYENGRRRQNVWTKRSWEEAPNAPPEYEPTVLSQAEARDIEQRNLAIYRGLPQNQNYTVSAKANSNAYSVDRDLVNSKAYHDKFEELTPHKPANENIYQQSKRLLEHRDGSECESLVVLDSRTGKLIVDNFKNPDQSLKTKLTDEQYDLVQSHNGRFIMLHNHPASVRPSGTDILSLWGQPKADRSIIVGHDGSVFEISNINRELPLDKIYKDAYNNAVENNIPKDYAKIIATNALYDTRAFDYVVR